MPSALNEQQFILFKIAGETYAVGVHETHEVIKYKKPKHVPHAPPHLLGVINLRGAIIPVVGLRERFSLEPREPDEETRIIVTHHNARLVGLVCDAVEKVVPIAQANIEENPDWEQKRAISAIRGVAHLDNEDSVIFLLALDAILTEDSSNAS